MKTSIFLLAILLAACSPAAAPSPIPSPTTAPLPTLSLDQTRADTLDLADFAALHAPLSDDPNAFLLLGSLPVSAPPAGLPPELAPLLGRWEGYGYFPPVNKDFKFVLVIQELTSRTGKAKGCSGSNLQFMDRCGDITFRVLPAGPAIQFQILWPGDVQEIDTYTYRAADDSIEGWAEFPATNTKVGPILLTRARSFAFYKDYPAYLENLRITPHPFADPALQPYGKGYLLYLPEGYKADPGKSWPLIFFLHGTGDRGDNLLLLAKASPFLYIRENGPLPFIIAAPLLSANPGYSSFPDAYLAGALAEIRSVYRVDPARIYLTGLSMGGEAAYRLAVQQPETFAALIPLSAYVTSETYARLDRLNTLPVWVIHGENDAVFPLDKAHKPVDAIQSAGGDVRLTILQDHDHDTWTTTYADPAFYDWLLAHQRP